MIFNLRCSELAFQIADQFRAFGATINFRVCVIVGGIGIYLDIYNISLYTMQYLMVVEYIDMVAQQKELASRPHVVVATPGRLADHITCGNRYHIICR